MANTLPLCSIFALGRSATTLPAKVSKSYRSLAVTRWGGNGTKYTKVDSKWETIVNIVCSNTEIASDIGTVDNGMIFKSFRPWNTIGMKMLPFKDRREMLRPSQVSEPITTIQSH